MDSISKLLLDILEELKIEDLKKFQWHLTNSVEDDKRIPKSHLENTDRLDTVDKMVQKYDPDGASLLPCVLRSSVFIALCAEVRCLYCPVC
uniref:Pyrin domain-containing protein n=1 Tax=Electrophorus electricus TaxID=8005 RepID=A0AAY5F5S8_ELEEL